MNESKEMYMCSYTESVDIHPDIFPDCNTDKLDLRTNRSIIQFEKYYKGNEQRTGGEFLRNFFHPSLNLSG